MLGRLDEEYQRAARLGARAPQDADRRHPRARRDRGGDSAAHRNRVLPAFRREPVHHPCSGARGHASGGDRADRRPDGGDHPDHARAGRVHVDRVDGGRRRRAGLASSPRIPGPTRPSSRCTWRSGPSGSAMTGTSSRRSGRSSAASSRARRTRSSSAASSAASSTSAPQAPIEVEQLGYDLKDAQAVAREVARTLSGDAGHRGRLRQPRGELPAVRHRGGSGEGGGGRALAAGHRPGRALLPEQQREREPVDLHRPAHGQPVQHGRPARRAVPVDARGPEPPVRRSVREAAPCILGSVAQISQGTGTRDGRAQVPAARRQDRGQSRRPRPRARSATSSRSSSRPCPCRPASRSSSAGRPSSSGRRSAASSSRRSSPCLLVYMVMASQFKLAPGPLHHHVLGARSG